MTKKNKKQWKDLKPFEKFIAYGVGAVVVIAIIMGLTGAFDETEEEKVDREERQEQREQASAEKKEAKEEKKDKETEKEDTETESNEDDITWDDLKDKDKIIGKSNKDFKELTKSKPSKVRDDKTGDWRVSTISKSVDITEYALSYKDLYMEEGQTHFIVNFSLNTTTWLSYYAGILQVETRERVDKEEHHADTLGRGMTLKNYKIYPDGDVQELDMED